MKARLSTLISLLLILSSLVSSSLLFIQQMRLANRSIQEEAFSDINITLTHLQNVLNTQLATDNLEDAKLSMSVSALHRDIRTLLLADEKDNVVLASHFIWEGSPATQVSGYALPVAQQVRQNHAGSVSFNAQNALLSGYYPVTLKFGTGGLGASRIGALFVEYDLSAKQAKARHDAMMQAVLFGGLMIAVAVCVALLLHWLVTRRVNRLAETAKRFAAGDLDARASLRGNDELAQLGHAFDDMASQRKQAEAALRLNEERLRFMLETSPIAVHIASDAGRRVVFSNQRYAELIQTKPTAVSGIDPQRFFALPQMYEDILLQLARGESVANILVELNVPGGETRWAQASFLQLEYAHQPAVLGWYYDITERKRLDEQLKAYQDQLEELVKQRTALLDQAQSIGHIGNWIWDVASGRIAWSDEIYRIFGYQPGEFEPTYERFLATVHPDDLERIKQSERDAISRGNRHSVDHRIVLPNGEIRWVHEEAFASLDEHGRALSLSGTVQDITERKHIEEALINSRNEAERANQSKSEFLARMSHELRTPMNAILGFSQLLESDPLEPDQMDSVHEIHIAGDHLLELINDLLDLSRIESGRLAVALSTVELKPLIEQTIQWATPMAEEKQIILSNKCATDDIWLYADPTRLKQVLINLVSNAVKYNRRGGSATIECHPAGGEERIRLAVTDSGPGIAPENLQHLFTPFQRLGAELSEIEGTGIGLALCMHLAEMMGGSLGVKSTPGQGSSFWIELPLAQVSQTSQTQQQPAIQAKGAQSTVLYIEDNLANLRLVEAIFRRQANLTLLTATNGDHGLELAIQYRPDVILLDIHLPGMDGYAVLKELQRLPETSAIPVIALSADAMQIDIERGLAAGFRYYLTKPLNTEDLVNKVNELLPADAESAAIP